MKLTHQLACKVIRERFSKLSLQMLNVAKDWVCSFLPHCLSKIDRVSYGIVHRNDLDRWEAMGAKDLIDSMPKSRKLLAIPFIGKDVPSTSSEFAHPDVLIGLSILAYRYEGMRKSDIVALVRQLKKALEQEPGPYSERPTSMLFTNWVHMAHLAKRKAATSSLRLSRQQEEKDNDSDSDSDDDNSTDAKKDEDEMEILPLELFQLEDERQVKALMDVFSFLPEVILHYLGRMVFPAVMLHQKTKIQASGFDIGSDMLFGIRCGFSGTPSDILPVHLKPCHFEPGSEAHIVRVLSNPEYVTHETVETWSVQSLLKHIATADPPFHALIDVGALVTGMNNEQVARFLLSHGLRGMDACVFLDPADRKVVVDRTSSAPVSLEQSGISVDRLFTFFDQVHTTGMDVKQALDARAAVTVGKDTTLRDYAQGCWRMRGLGRGQSAHVLVVKEVSELIKKTSASGDMLSDLMNWLLRHSIASEQLQHLQLCQQGIHYVWRKGAFKALLGSAKPNAARSALSEILGAKETPSCFSSRFHELLEEDEVKEELAAFEIIVEEEEKKEAARKALTSSNSNRDRSGRRKMNKLRVKCWPTLGTHLQEAILEL
eukprot:TRINITY_DN3317_c0_g2_i1.p1 TRINITY_DN3317_c0_g2~~TRINITY_DN3317_c0_g2_i1.p1  ORF type:complete len:610 (-),score=129.98 TRINITY_DN3317_c0_g2_i1:245-2047(-)